MFSFLILTKNEEHDLPGCLDSISWNDDIHVFDSFSTDRTLDIAEQAGVSITQRIFDGYASQRNAALQTLEFKYSWVFVLDADERIPLSLIREIKETLTRACDSTAAFRVRRRDFFRSRWLKYSQISPYFVRLLKVGKCRYYREINEVVFVDGKTETLTEHFDHFPFSKGIHHWLHKHNLYSSMEAARWLKEHTGEIKFSFRSAVLDGDFNVRRYHQKGLFYKMPGRPILKWFYMVLIRRAFLDGSPGMIYATLQSIYEYLIVLKTRELIDDIERQKKAKSTLSSNTNRL